MLGIITRIFICLYWVVLIGFNIRNYINMPKEVRKRNLWIKMLIIVNAIVVLCTAISIFIGA